MNLEILSFKNFKNASVKDLHGNTLGDVHDVMMDLQTGEIAFVVLASGGFLGLGENYLPVPYRAIRYNSKTDSYQTDIPKEKFRGAPQLDTEDRTTKPDRQYIKKVNSYYGY